MQYCLLQIKFLTTLVKKLLVIEPKITELLTKIDKHFGKKLCSTIFIEGILGDNFRGKLFKFYSFIGVCTSSKYSKQYININVLT